MAASGSRFPFRNTMYNIRGNRQAQGIGHGPPGEDPPGSVEPQRAEQPLPSNPGTPGELRFGLSSETKQVPSVSSPVPFVLNMKFSRSLLLVSMGLAAVTPFFFFLN